MKRERSIKLAGLVSSVLMVMLLSSCTKDTEDLLPTQEPEDLPSSAFSNVPRPVDADGSMWAIKLKNSVESPIGGVETTIGTAKCFFTSSTGDWNSFVNAGAITLNGEELTRQDNNAYSHIPSMTDLDGIELSSEVIWEVEGGNGINGFSHELEGSFPSVGDVTSSSTIDREEDYTLTVNQVSDADSVLFSIGGVVKIMEPNTTSCHFSAEDLSGLTAGQNFAQVAAIRYYPQTIHGKKIYFGTQNAYSKTVTIE